MTDLLVTNPFINIYWNLDSDLNYSKNAVVLDLITHNEIDLSAENLWIVRLLELCLEKPYTLDELIIQLNITDDTSKNEITNFVLDNLNIFIFSLDNISDTNITVTEYEEKGWKLPIEYYVYSFFESKNLVSTTIKERKKADTSNQLFLDLNLDLLKNRRTCRKFTLKSIPKDLLLNILDFSFSIVSACKVTFSISAYVFALNIESLEKGLYKYTENTLDIIKCKFNEDQIAEILIGQNYTYNCCAVIFLASNYINTIDTEKNRHYVNLLTTIGEVGQNIITGAIQHDMDCFQTPAIKEDFLFPILGITNTVDSDIPYYCVAIGYK